MIDIFMPHQNLNCFGVRIRHPNTGAQLLYFDVRIDTNRPVLYVNTGKNKYTIGIWFIHKWK